MSGDGMRVLGGGEGSVSTAPFGIWEEGWEEYS